MWPKTLRLEYRTGLPPFSRRRESASALLCFALLLTVENLLLTLIGWLTPARVLNCCTAQALFTTILFIEEAERDIPVILSKAADQLIAGEILELDHSGDMSLSFETYNRIIDGKTAALINAAARIGAILAGFDKHLVEKCAEMGSHFGIAFQIIDDLLDYGYGSKNLDKAKFTDLSNGLITLPLLYYFESSSAEERSEMEDLIKRASEDNVPALIKQRLIDKGAFDKAKASAQDHLEKALEIAQSLPESAFTDEIIAMFASMSNRGN